MTFQHHFKMTEILPNQAKNFENCIFFETVPNEEIFGLDIAQVITSSSTFKTVPSSNESSSTFSDD